MHNIADHGIDHGDQQLPIIPESVTEKVLYQPGDGLSDGSSPHGLWYHSSGLTTRNLWISDGNS
jgi:hypothetical protein